MVFKIDYSQSTLKKNLDDMSEKLGAAILMYAVSKASVLEAQMKQRRPWTDRTNMAKTTLNAKVSQPSEGVVRITLAHGVEYGINLELDHGKKYAIVGPTVRLEGPRMVTDLSNFLSKIKL